MNAQIEIENHTSSPNRGVQFKVRPAIAAAVCCAVLVFLAVQLVGFAAGVEMAVRTVAAIHIALATGIVSGLFTVMFVMDDKDEREATTPSTSWTTRPQHDPRPTTKRAA